MRNQAVRGPKEPIRRGDANHIHGKFRAHPESLLYKSATTALSNDSNTSPVFAAFTNMAAQDGKKGKEKNNEVYCTKSRFRNSLIGIKATALYGPLPRDSRLGR